MGTAETAYAIWQQICAAMGSECQHCSSSWDYDFQPNTEAFEISGQCLCNECAEAVFEDNGQFGVGA